MGNLDIRIKHGGGGFNSPMLWIVVAAIIAVVVIAGAASVIASALMTLAIIAASVLGGSVVLGGVVWFLTRGARAQRAQAFEDYRAHREEAHHRRQMDMVRAKAQIKAQEHAAMAAMVAEAIRAGQQQPIWPQIGYAPPTIKAEVVKPDEDKH